MAKWQIQVSIMAFLLIITAVTWIVFIPEAKAQTANRLTHVQEEELRVEKEALVVDSYRDILNRYDNNLKGILMLQDYLARDPYLSQHQTSDTLETLARKNRMRLTRVSYQMGRGQNRDLTAMKIDLPLAGSYRDFRRFLLDLEEREPYLAINEIRVEGMEDTGSITVELSLTSYFTKGVGHD